MATNNAFGCGTCFQGEAAQVWRAKPFESVARLVDESHFSVDVMACRTCGQRCVKIFTEFVDWSGGDDAQYWSVIPLTGEEAEKLIAQGEGVNAKQMEAMSRSRRYLQADYPTGKGPRIRWSEGPVWIIPG